MIIVTKGYFCPTCNKELQITEICAIVGHSHLCCRYCHNDIDVFIKGVKHEELRQDQCSL